MMQEKSRHFADHATLTKKSLYTIFSCPSKELEFVIALCFFGSINSIMFLWLGPNNDILF